MPKFFGKVGLCMDVETSPGIWDKKIVEKEYFGDVIRDTRRFQNHSHLNDDITISNSFSIVVDKEAYANFHQILYVDYMGTKWKVESVDASNPPRLVLDVGGEYKGA